MFVQCLVDVLHPRGTRNWQNECKSRRQHTLQFHLKKEGVRVRVCKKMFLNTIGISEWSAINWAESAKSKKRGDPLPKKKFSRKKIAMRESVYEFLNSLPKVPSHCCRQNTSRLYLEPIFVSKKELYREYKRLCEEKQIMQVASRTLFNEITAEMNISIYKPRKDKCDLCTGHELGTISDSVYNEHNEKKQEAIQAKEYDKERGKLVFIMDMEVVLICPRTRASSMYYTKQNWLFITSQFTT